MIQPMATDNDAASRTTSLLAQHRARVTRHRAAATLRKMRATTPDVHLGSADGFETAPIGQPSQWLRERPAPRETFQQRMKMEVETLDKPPIWNVFYYRGVRVQALWGDSVEDLASVFDQIDQTVEEKARKARDSVRLPAFKINRWTRSALRNELRRKRRRLSRTALEKRLGYVVDELRSHLEGQFADGMNWANHGEWHIDHIRPLSSFKITSFRCRDFREAWAISNLQPLWAADNLRKGARWEP
jgi:hypothetical protein